MIKEILFVTILATVLMFMTSNSLENIYKREKSKIEANIGEKVVIEKDTLLILDYSFLESNYTLSDGRKVSFELIKKLK